MSRDTLMRPDDRDRHTPVGFYAGWTGLHYHYDNFLGQCSFFVPDSFGTLVQVNPAQASDFIIGGMYERH